MAKIGNLHMSPVSSSLIFGEVFHKGLLFLLNLAWDARFRLPVLITVGFMVLDIRMQLEINVDVEIRAIMEPNAAAQQPQVREVAVQTPERETADQSEQTAMGSETEPEMSESNEGNKTDSEVNVNESS